MYRFITLFFFTTSFFVFSQNPDSLRISIRNAPNDTNKITAYVKLGRFFLGDHPDSALLYFKIAKNLSENGQKENKEIKQLEKAYQRRIATSQYFLGTAFLYLGKYEEAIPAFKIALGIRRQLGDKKGEASTLNNMALVFQEQGRLTEALECFRKSLNLKIETSDSNGIVNALGNIANIYKFNSQYKEAKDYYEQSLQLSKKIGNKHGIESNLHNLATIFQLSGQKEKAFDYYKEVVKLCDEIDDMEGKALAFNNMAQIYFSRNQISDGLKFKDEALLLYKKMSDKKGEALVYSDLGEMYLSHRDFMKALKNSLISLQLGREIGNPEVVFRSAKVLKDVYKNNGDFFNAYKMLELYKIMGDSISNEETKKDAIKKKWQIEYERRSFTDSLRAMEKHKNLSIKLATKEADIKRERIQKMALYCGLLLVLIFCIVLFNRFKVTQGQKKIIEHQKNIVEEHRKEIIDSINYAKRIQYTLLAHKEFLKENLPEHFVLFKPKDIVSGDFYWATKRNGKFYLAVCDSTGHGVPGAFMSLLNIGFLSEAINEKGIINTNEVFDYVRKKLVENLSKEGQKDGFDGILVCIDEQNKKITYSAANNYPLLIRSNSVFELEIDKMPVGIGEKRDGFRSFNIEYEKGDMLFLYTDGFADQFGGPKGKKFKYKQLNELLRENHKLELSDQMVVLEKSLDAWKGNLEQIDDICVFGIKL